MKHAYLIMAHNKFWILEQLLKCIDDVRNDIYIHIDKKVRDFNFDYYGKLCTKSRIIFVTPRLNVRWGDKSQVQLELLLFKTALMGNYSRYHLISGVDLPLKTQDELHSIFNKDYTEYINFTQNLSTLDYKRISRYHFHETQSKVRNKLIFEFSKVQEKLNVDRFKKYKLKFYKGGNWCSFSHNCLSYIVSQEKFIRQLIRYTACADECYKQIIIGNSEYLRRCYVKSGSK